MSIDYVTEYESLLKDTILGAQIRGFIFGYNSDSVNDYLTRQKQRIQSFVAISYNDGEKIHTRKNMHLSSELLGLEVKIIKNRFNIV